PTWTSGARLTGRAPLVVGAVVVPVSGSQGRARDRRAVAGPGALEPERRALAGAERAVPLGVGDGGRRTAARLAVPHLRGRPGREGDGHAPPGQGTPRGHRDVGDEAAGPRVRDAVGRGAPVARR